MSHSHLWNILFSKNHQFLKCDGNTSIYIFFNNTENTYLFLGPDLPESCTYSSMVTSPSGQGVILFGCNENPIGEHFYELTTNENGNFSWKIMAQKMTFPRSGATAMLLPDELVSCT